LLSNACCSFNFLHDVTIVRIKRVNAQQPPDLLTRHTDKVVIAIAGVKAQALWCSCADVALDTYCRKYACLNIRERWLVTGFGCFADRSAVRIQALAVARGTSADEQHNQIDRGSIHWVGLPLQAVVNQFD
jgi:hypothetical protein